MMSTFNVNVAMFYPPNGKKKWKGALVSKRLKSNYNSMLESGCIIEGELLSTGEIAVSLENDEGYIDLKISRVKSLDVLVEEILTEKKWRDKVTS